jgi:DNA-directed RNA polymerase delta subunit
MEEKLHINLADCAVGPEELDWLLTEWRKDPRPKTINELARDYLAHRYEDETGFLPYDIRKTYKEKDKIIVRTTEGWLDVAEVVRVAKKIYRDTGDIIDVRLLGSDAKLKGKDNRQFVANYQGTGFSIPEFKTLEVITEKDESDVIPKLLLALADDDKRFANFGEYWLPLDCLIDVSTIKDDVRKIIEKSEQPLSTHDILEKVYANGNKEELNERLEFSLNYFLEHDHDKIFVRINGQKTKWDLRKPPLPKTRWAVTIKPEWLEKDILIVPRKLSAYLEKTNTVHILYDQVDELLPYNNNDRRIKGLDKFYSKKAIAEWDRVHLQLQALEPAKLFISSRWQKRLDRLLKIKPTDLHWEHTSLRDCIIVVLAKSKTPAHYREIYSEIAPHKQVLLGSIIATLSRYSPLLFVHAGYCQWQLAGWICPNEHLGQEPAAEDPKTPEISDEIWKAVAVIEDNDYVYKLLQKAEIPLSFDEICSRLADYLKVDVNQLRDTGFLMPDKRFRRLDNGTWTLEEWFRRPESAGPVQTEPAKPEKSSWAYNLWLVLTHIVSSVKRYYGRLFNLIFRQQILRK